MIALNQAQKAISAAIKFARTSNMKPLAIIVVDTGGHPVAFARENGATLLRFDVAHAKAWTALSLASSSRNYQTMADDRPHFAASLNAITEGKMAASAGGLVILDDEDEIVGAIGISGDFPDNDELAAQAGIDVL
ncbi:heme-binding protein [Parasphingopyxis algicola]|uniref:GlcG/HbpS family heme-binding protein n=1 Tax=Parasphingopyxis algicola TaxID=2026624 RepID=UPI0015A3F2EE|nr:heme-binding protein [Parasphingopyxis algicola]QLC26356.1 heme-binding protein [Parasphingopyxis algicola]